MKRRDALKALILAPAAPAVIAKAMEAKPAVMEFHYDHLPSLARRFGGVIEQNPPLPDYSSITVREYGKKLLLAMCERCPHQNEISVFPFFHSEITISNES